MKAVGLAWVVMSFLAVSGWAVSQLTVTPSPNVYGWNNTPVTVTITGVPPIEWRVNGGPVNSSPSPVSFALSAEGIHLIDYKDSTESEFKRATVRIDRTPPEGAIRVPEPGGVYILGQPLAADWSVWDNLSGVAKVEATAGRGEPVDTRFPGQQTFKLRIEDRAGNEAEVVAVYFVRGILKTVFPSNFYLDRVLPPEEQVKVGRRLVQARYTVGEGPQLGFLMVDYFGCPYTRAWPEITVVRVVWEEDEEKYPVAGWFRVPFDSARGHYFLALPAEKFSAGIYELWVLFGDGQFERIRIDFQPKP